MITLNKNINLSKFFNSTSLIARQAARDIFTIVASCAESEIMLDFSNIQNVARSFFDELNSYNKKIRLLRKNVQHANLNSNLEQLYNLVIRKSETNGISYASTANAKHITI